MSDLTDLHRGSRPALGVTSHVVVPDPPKPQEVTATREVRYPLPWNWEGLDERAVAESWRRLSAWVSWFVARYGLARDVPACWWRHPELADELRALWYYHQAVTAPLVDVNQPDAAGAAEGPKPPEVSARLHWEWHEARQRWITGPLRAAATYYECARGRGHNDDPYAQEATEAFVENSKTGIEQAADAGELLP